MRQPHASSRQGGFTLIEAMLAAFICGGAVLACLGATSQFSRSSRSPLYRYIAYQDALRVVEGIRNGSFEKCCGNDGSQITAVVMSATTPDNRPTYRRLLYDIDGGTLNGQIQESIFVYTENESLTVEDITGDPTADLSTDPNGFATNGLQKITVTVSWRQQDGLRVGEDANFDGVWNSGEDTISTTPANYLDSPVEVFTYHKGRRCLPCIAD